MKFLDGFVIGCFFGPTPHGVGGLKSGIPYANKDMSCPTPHGVGGLKSQPCCLLGYLWGVPPRTGWVD